MASQTSVVMSVVCRCCLQKESELINIFEENAESNSLSYAAIVKSCIGLQVKVGDGLPDRICIKCSKEASSYFNFKKMCLNSYQQLREKTVTDLELSKEVSCQTDEYIHGSSYPTENVFQSKTKEKEAINSQSINVESSKESEPTDVQRGKNKCMTQNEGNTEEIQSNSSKPMDQGFSHVNESNSASSLSPYVKGDTDKKEDESSNSGNSNLNDTSKDDENCSPETEIQDSVMDEDIAINTPDLPLSDESIFTVLDISKEKDNDVMEVNELGEVVEKLSSCNSQLSGDFCDWLEGNEAKDKNSNNNDLTDTLLDSTVKENIESNERSNSGENVVTEEAERKNQTESSKESTGKTTVSDEHSKPCSNDDVAQEQEKPNDKSQSNEVEDSAELKTEVSGSEIKPMEGKLVLKSIESLTIANFAGVNKFRTSFEAEKSSSGEDNLKVVNSVEKSGQKIDGTLEKIHSNTLNDNIKLGDHSRAESGDGQSNLRSPTATEEAEEVSNNSTSRKRPRCEEDDDPSHAVDSASCEDPSIKKQCTSLEGNGELKNLKEDVNGAEVSSHDVEKTFNTNSEHNDNGAKIAIGKESDGLGSNAEIPCVEDDSEQMKNFSDDGVFEDNDSEPESSGSEYVPADSPAGSDDERKPLRRLHKRKTQEKSESREPKDQDYKIKECRVVLSDIAYPGSSTITAAGSISSAKSSVRDTDSLKESEEADQPTMCTAWIKVEPQSTLEEIENETFEEGNDAEENQPEDMEGQEHSETWPIPNAVDTAHPEGASAVNQRTLAKFDSGHKRFRCPFCAKTFRTKHQMMLHRSQHTGDLPFSCEVCGKGFALRCRLLRHMSVHDASITCEFCGMDFKTNFLLGKHIKAKHTIPSYSYTPVNTQTLANKSVQRFPCRICSKVFSSMNGLKVHKRVHVNSPLRPEAPIKEESIQSQMNSTLPSEIICQICGMSFPNSLYLKSHMVCHNIIRPNSGKMHSIESPKSFESTEDRIGGNVDRSGGKNSEESINMMEPTVVIHESPSNYGETSYQQQNQQYSGINQFICSVCSQIFQSRSQLLRHQTLIHRSLKCEICATMFSSAEQVQSHKLSEHPSHDPSVAARKVHTCADCGKGFPKRSRLVQHMAVHREFPVSASCEECGKNFPNQELLNKHKETHENDEESNTSNNSDLTCGICHRVFGRRSRLKKHMILHESQSHQCTKCPKTFISQELLTEHMNSHSSTSTAPATPAESEEQGVTCTACGRLFANKARLKQHVVVHTKSGFVSCNTCFKVFSNNQMLEMHAQTCVNADESSMSSQSVASSTSNSTPHTSGFTSCTTCTKAFPSKELLTEHEKTCVGLTVVKKLDGTWKVMDSEDRTRGGASTQNVKTESNSEPKGFPCKFCPKKFKNYHGLNSHMRFHQENVGVFKCEQCNQKFPSRNKLSQHMSSHSAVYKCGICSQAFGMVDELKKHVSQCMAVQSNITPNYFFCNVCSEVFKLLNELAEHVKCHVDEFPHVCSECFKVYAHPTQLSRHMDSHVQSEVNHHVCPVCQKSFLNSTALDKHMVVHSGEKRFQCPYCYQRFSQKSSLNRHQLTQHETRPFVKIL